MKTTAFVGSINKGSARLLISEQADKQIDVKLSTLAEYIKEPIEEEDILEITISKKEDVIHARKLFKATHQERLVCSPAKEQAFWEAANYVMPQHQQERLHELLEKNTEGILTESEREELNVLIEECERRTLAKAEAIDRLLLYDKAQLSRNTETMGSLGRSPTALLVSLK